MFDAKQLRSVIRCLVPAWRDAIKRPDLRALRFCPPAAEGAPWRLVTHTFDVSAVVEIHGRRGPEVALDGLELLEALPHAGRVAIGPDGVRWDGGAGTVAGFDLSDLPERAIQGCERLTSEPGKQLALALRQVAVSAAHEDGRYAVNGVRVEPEVLVATDGKRLSVRGHVDGPNDPAVLISRAASKTCAAVVAHSDEIRWAIDTNRIVVFGSSCALEIRSSTDNQFPPWRAVIAKVGADAHAFATVAARDLKGALTGCKTENVEITATESGGLSIDWQDATGATIAHRSAPADTIEPCTIGRYNTRFIRDVAGAAGARDNLELSGGGIESSCRSDYGRTLIVTAPAGVRHVIMPAVIDG